MGTPWMHDAYRHQKYAFVADYMRFYVLYHHGGIYMDTDMLLIKPIDALLNDTAFVGREDVYNISMGIVGAEKGSTFCSMCLELYDSTKFNMAQPPIITRFITPHLFQYGFTEEDTTQHLSNGLVVYQSSYFYPIHYSQSFDLDDIIPRSTQESRHNNPAGNYGGFVKEGVPTYAIHLWNKSWVDEIKLLADGRYKEGFSLAWKRFKRTPILPFKYWKKVVKYAFYYCFHRNRESVKS